MTSLTFSPIFDLPILCHLTSIKKPCNHITIMLGMTISLYTKIFQCMMLNLMTYLNNSSKSLCYLEFYSGQFLTQIHTPTFYIESWPGSELRHKGCITNSLFPSRVQFLTNHWWAYHVVQYQARGKTANIGNINFHDS